MVPINNAVDFIKSQKKQSELFHLYPNEDEQESNYANTEKSLHSGIIYSAKKKMNELKSACYNFNDWWPNHLLEIRIWPLPVSEKPTDLNIPWAPALDTITFETLSDDQAIAAAKHSISNFYRNSNDPALNIRRFPGFVRLELSARFEMIERINHINQIKHELREIIGLIPDGTRPVLLRKLWPGEHILAAYRAINYAADDVRLVHFTWQGRTPKNEKISYDQLVGLLTDEISEHLATNDILTASIRNNELQSIADLDKNTEFVVRKQLAPSPRMLAYYVHSVNRTGVADIMIQCPIPFFFAQNFPSIIKSLPEWSRDNKKNWGKKSDKYTLINPRLNIFLHEKRD